MSVNKIFSIKIVVLALLLQACSSSVVVPVIPADTDAVPPTPAETLQSNPPQPGSDVAIDQMSFVIIGSVRPADGIVASGDMFNPQPHEYQQYIFVTLAVTCKTTAGQQCHLNIFNISLLGRDGTPKYPQWYLSGVEGILKDTEFQGGTTVSGHVPFIISVGDSGLQLIYESSSGDDFYFDLP